MRLDDFIIFLDENLDNCKPIMDALAESGITCRRHADTFTRGEDDDVWLTFVGERSWIVLTKDKRNRYNQWEKEAVRIHRVREFYFGSGNFNAAEMADALTLALPEMRRICLTEEPPFVGSITRSGSVTIVADKHGSTHERRRAKRQR
ncbi:MAG TPA: hypothetical protein VNX88_21270 [Terriglobales bacterium]|nr:hypothetical protein [Terriglobales bacterium]